MPVSEDRVVDYYAVDAIVVVRVDEGVLEEFAVNFAEVKSEATTATLASVFVQIFWIQRITRSRESSKSKNMLTFQYMFCLSILRTLEQQDRS